MKRITRLLCLMGVGLASTWAMAATLKDVEASFNVEHELFKHKRNGTWKDVEHFGSGSCSGGGCSATFQAPVDDVRYIIQMDYDVGDKSFHCIVKVRPEESGSGQGERQFQIPISDLQTTTIKLLEGRDGNDLYYTIVPKVVPAGQAPQPELASSSKLFETWDLDSVVLLNDKTYVGRLTMTGGPVASYNIVGVGKIQMAMQPFGQAQEIGILNNGNLVIHGPKETTIEMTNVKHGRGGVVLPNGPYKVFVQWDDFTAEEVETMISSAKKRMETSGGAIQKALQYWIEKLEKGEPTFAGHGVGPAGALEPKN